MDFNMIDKGGQITIFIIIGILLVSAIALVFVLYNGQLSSQISNTQRQAPQEYEDCINDYVAEASDLIFENGGFLEMQELNYLIVNSAGYYDQQEVKEIPFLCYTPLDYARCIPQRPLFINHLEKEIKEFIMDEVDSCFETVNEDLEANSYEVSFERTGEVEVEISDGVIKTRVSKVFTQKRSNQEQRFEEFTSRLSSSLYSMGRVAQEIVNQESLQCNSDYVDIMRANPTIKIKKFNADNDVSVYTIEDTIRKKEWKFAVRNCKQTTPS